MKMMPTDSRKKPNWRCENPICGCEFYFDCGEVLGDRFAEMAEDEKPRCPYCGSFDTVKK